MNSAGRNISAIGAVAYPLSLVQMVRSWPGLMGMPRTLDSRAPTSSVAVVIRLWYLRMAVQWWWWWWWWQACAHVMVNGRR